MNISDIYDQIKIVISGALTGYKQMTYANNLNENGELLKIKSFAINVGQSQNTDRNISCKESFIRVFNIIVYNSFLIKRNGLLQSEDIQKDFLTDIDYLVKALGTNSTLNDTCAHCEVIGDSGIIINEDDDTYKSMRISINVSVEYFM